MYQMLQIPLAEHIEKDQQKHDDLITIESIRDYILKLCDNEPDEIRDLINNKTRSLSSVLYGRPHENMVRIFSIGDKGRQALNAIFVNLVTAGSIKIKNKHYKIKGTPKIHTEVDTLPVCDGATYTYTTLTPMMIFNRKNQPVFQAIAGRHFEENKYFEKSTPERRKAFYEDLEKFVNEQIKDSIQYFLSFVFEGKSKEEFEFVDQIKIEWENMRILFAKYHTEERALPMIIGKFKSNFSLPKFVGYKTGKGFGEVSLKSRIGGDAV